MILIDSNAAKIGLSNVKSITSATSFFRQFICYFETNISTAITGAVGLIKNGAAQLTLSGTCNYTGTTTINHGILNITSSSTLNGVISGGGMLYLKRPTATTLTLGGNNTYTGGTEMSGGFTVCNASNSFGTGAVVVKTQFAPGSEIRTTPTMALPNDFLLEGALTVRVIANTLTLSGVISGIGSLKKVSPWILVLTNNNTYTGGTSITAGTIVVTKIVDGISATGTFTAAYINVNFNNVIPVSGSSYQFFPSSFSPTNLPITLLNAGGKTGTFNYTNSTLTIN